MRFPIRFTGGNQVLMGPIGMTPSRCYVDVDEDHLRVRMGMWFELDTERTLMRAAEPDHAPVLGWGVHGWRGRWLVNGSSSGLVRIIKDLSASIADEDVLLVEDIIDTGLTLNYLVRYLRGKNPASLRICTLLDKPARRLVDIPVDYQGFEIPDQFVVGYGLDYGEIYRNLRFVGVLRPEVYAGE